MTATTRSQTKQNQTRVEDFEPKEENKAQGQGSKSKRAATTKRKKETEPRSERKRTQSDNQTNAEDAARSTKKQKQKQPSLKPEEDVSPAGDATKPVLINRAPVLQLWAACVSQALYPVLPWATHLSIGSAISTLCAIAKGRAIGLIEKPSDDPAERAEKERKRRAAEEGADDEINVMRFRLLLKDGGAIVSGRPQKANEVLLRNKFGQGDEYERVKRAMEEAIDTWRNRGQEKEFNVKAFHMYEEFRPSVQRGQGGWGKKGELRPEKIREVVSRD
ncbi:uncharacterized protein A1O5_01950 [Cladophialophora psammophila CBS 110553]|uniref:Uncharacterized protein n=1 Tax=Cladophialophora psammophila CBS 110553 TaxID=1182543 RepID=W9XY86_9EURO|nr:uncharacterized protein A1O5_01950 [Cladophialophora psammophila CBS 110553]EXJ75254.1 hypothetical protein A1O5_01950 [Cladophialophora psammophila CBS 110553]